ncbi:MAG: putative ABC transporter permease [Bacilli bacterium]|nr:putative ABC transporter permease [Bacilli bacterium]
MYHFLFLFSLFIIYSFIGWTIEMVVCASVDKKIVNRGFLVGPYCPIYGFSSLIMIGVLQKYLNDAFVLFIMAIFICTFTEYITSYIMEKIFHARWWDYTNIPFNLNGRVCLTNSICFGILGTILLYVLNPMITNFLESIKVSTFNIIFFVIYIIFFIDVVTSINIINKLKITADSIRKDYTEEITSKVKDVIFKNSLLSRRLIRAFPNITFKILNIRKK